MVLNQFWSKRVILIVGLGNPGLQYSKTRHNLGYMVIDSLAERVKISLTYANRYAVWGIGEIYGRKFILTKPKTYMNLSGKAVKSLMNDFNIPSQYILIVHDDLDLRLGELKLKIKGGDGGHRGIASIIHELNIDNNRFIRIKVGIGRPQFGESIENFVLSEPYINQWRLFIEMIEMAVDYLEVVLIHGSIKAMQNYNSIIHSNIKDKKLNYKN